MASSDTGCDPVVIESDENNSSQNELDSENNFNMILMKLKQKFNCTRKNLCSTKNVTHLSGGRKEVRDILCFQKWSGNIFVFLLLVLSPSELSAHLVCFLQREDCA